MNNSTTIVITTSGQNIPVPNSLLSPDQIVNMYSSLIPGIGSMESETTTDDAGNRTVTFRPRTGTKG